MIDSGKLVPSAEVRRLRAGSYEQKIERVAAAVQEHFGETPAHVVATREDEAVVLLGEQFMLVSFANGAVLGHEPIEVEVLDEADQHRVLQREVADIVGLYLGGARDKAAERLTELAPMVRIRGAAQPDKIVETLEWMVNADRFWTGAYKEREEAICAFLDEPAQTLEEARLHPVFRKLYDGLIKRGNLDGYTDLVDDDLAMVTARLEAVYESVSEAVESLSEAPADSSGGEDVLPMFEGFATDLLDDLRSIREMGRTAVRRIADVRTRGKLRDLMAEALHSREVAGRFVVAVADRLIATQ